jgi:hypothetical protein
MLAALATNIYTYIYIYENGYLFPLYSSTAFKLTCEESIKNATQLDRVDVQEPL